ncbi:hypothetical protein AB0J74_06345 [Asanoa sp. NPDC049573]|uniref:hypothetical protein n=1 Tax=Asanoa sp. NPDC049573 TaxID=3155396 RepID=UPI00344B0003
MTRSAPRSRARSGALSVLLSILVVALLVPTGVLFAQNWRAQGDRAAATARELDGVAYLRTLQQVAFAVVDAQSATVENKPVSRDAIVVAVQQADATDARLGGRLHTTDRWNGIRSRLETLRAAPPAADPTQTVAAYREVGDLLLALYAKVRDESGLSHDPDADAFHLQSSAATELPIAVIATGRLADAAVLGVAARKATAGKPPTAASQQQLFTLVSELAAQRATVQNASDKLVDDLRAAVDSTESRTLGGNLLSRLDRYQRTADVVVASFSQAATAAAGSDGSQPAADESLIGSARAGLQAAAGELSSTILNEVERLLNTRSDAIDRNRLLTGGAAVVAVLLAVGFFLAYFLGGRQRPARPTGPFPEAGPANPDALPPDRATSWPTVAPITGAPYQDASQQHATQWERSGATR